VTYNDIQSQWFPSNLTERMSLPISGSNLGHISHRFRYIASFPSKNAPNGFQSHPKLMIYTCMSFESQYATSYL